MVHILFTDTLGLFKDKKFKDFTKSALEQAPSYFFNVPASASGKYHPDYSLGMGGLVRHTKAMAHIANALHTIGTYDLTDYEFDMALVAIHLHDLFKQGTTDEGSGHTQFSHPLLAGWHVRNIGVPESCNLIYSEREVISDAIESHMGQWNTTKESAIVLPLPETSIQKFVHMCDYLGSRKFLEFNFSKV